MEETCQRCNETLRETDRYCPVCGLPQLMYVPGETPPIPLGDDPPAGNDPANAINGIAWRPALQAALVLAVPAGVLCSGISPLGLIWMVGAAVWAVALYAKRARPGWLSMGAGARIGLITGLFASWLTLSLDGITLWTQRFLMHQGSQMDSDWQASVNKIVELDQQMISEMGIASTQATQSLDLQRVWMLSPDGRAGFALMTFLTGTAFLVFFATIGGALSARVLAQPRRPKTS